MKMKALSLVVGIYAVSKRLAYTIMSVPPTSVEAERAFSTAGIIAYAPGCEPVLVMRPWKRCASCVSIFRKMHDAAADCTVTNTADCVYSSITLSMSLTIVTEFSFCDTALLGLIPCVVSK